MSYKIGSVGTASLSTLPVVSRARPVGSSILVEMLTDQEMTSATIHITNNDGDKNAPQGYVLEVGPNLDVKAGISKGMRVLLQGNYVPVPNWNKNHRNKGVVEIHNIKAILEEAEVASEEEPNSGTCCGGGTCSTEN